MRVLFRVAAALLIALPVLVVLAVVFALAARSASFRVEAERGDVRKTVVRQPLRVS